MAAVPIGQEVLGLGLGPRKVSAGVQGYMLEATNLICRYENVLEPRFAIRSTGISSTGLNRLYVDPYSGLPILSHLSSASLKSLTLDGTTASYTLSPSYAVSGLAMNQNTTVLMTDAGLRRFYGMTAGSGTQTSNAGAATDLGYVPEGLDSNLNTLADSSGFLADLSWCAYRIVFGIRDANNRIFLGAPGGRLIVANQTGSTGYSGGQSKNVTVRFTVPTEAGYTFTATTTTSDATLTSLSSFAHINRGHRLYGTGIPANTTVSSSPLFGTELEMSNNATANGSITVTAVRLFYQIYRTDPVVIADTNDPGDEMFLVYEDWFNATDLSNGYVDVTDYVPALNGGTELYTNATAEGIEQANSPCEAASNAAGTYAERGVIANYADCIFAAVFKPRIQQTVNLLAVLTTGGINARSFTADTSSGSPTLSSVSSFTGIATGMRVKGTGIPADTTISSFNSGGGTITMSANASATNSGVTIVAGDVITVDGVNYYAYNAETIANREFLVSTNSSAAVAVRDTAQSFVRVFNRSTSTTNFYAHYTSQINKYPGKILIVARSDRSTATKTISVSGHPQAWEPNLSTPLNFLSASNFSKITYSKPNLPLAFPANNEIVLPENAVPVSFKVLRGALLVLSTKGLFRIIGSYGLFRLEMVDESIIAAKDNTTFRHWYDGVVLQNTAYFMTTQGVVATTGTGTEVVSENVNPLLFDNSSTGQPFVEPNNQLVLFPVSTGTLVYNARFDLWTFIDTLLISGEVSSRFVVPKLYMINTTGSVISQSNNLLAWVASDLYDSTTSVTISSVSSSALTVTLSADPSASVGDVILQGGSSQTITAVAGAVLTVSSVSGFSAGAATLYRGYDCTALYSPIKTQGNTGEVTQAHIIMDVPDLTGNYANNATSGLTVPVYYRSKTDNQSSAVLSTAKFYTPESVPDDLRYLSPRSVKRFSNIAPGFKSRTCRQHYRFSGMELEFEPISERTKRA